MPNRRCQRRSHRGDHQLTRPASRMNAGTSVAADQERVDEHREREADAERLDQRDLRRRDADEHDREQQRGGGDDAAGLLRARSTTACSLSRSRSYSSLMREQEEDLVVHREPERDAEHQDRREHVDGARRREAEQVREVALLEDPHHRAERRGQRQHVQQQRLERHEEAAGHQEQQHERRERDEPERERQPATMTVPSCRRARADEPGHEELERRGSGADVLHELLALHSTAARRRARPRGTCRAVPAAAANRLRERRSAGRTGRRVLPITTW